MKFLIDKLIHLIQNKKGFQFI